MITGESSQGACVQIVRIRPLPGRQARLRELREPFVAAIRQAFPEFVGCELIRPDDGSAWLDLWTWSSREAAERARATADDHEAFRRWSACVEVLEFSYGELGLT